MKSKLKFYGVVMIMTTIVFSGCSDDHKDTPEDPSKANYALTVTGGTYPNQTTYLFGTHDFPADGVGTSNAKELPSSGAMYRYGSYVYISTFGAPATLRRFGFDDNGKPSEAGSFSIPSLRTFGTVHFISETEAYAASNGYGGVPKLVKFNPSTMQIVSTIDLSSTHKPESVGGDYYFGMVDRGNDLFLGITYTNANGDALYDNVYVAVINKTTGTVSKLLSDNRSSEMWNGGSAASFQPNCFVKDAMGDIYVMGYANGGKPSGILRIKNGTTDFDASYFFDLNAATGKSCLGLWSFNGLTFTVAYDEGGYPFDLDASYNTVAKGNYYKIDLAARTSSGNISSSLPKFYGNSSFMTQWNGSDKIYFNVPAANSNAIYSYTVATGAVRKEFGVSAGTINGFTKF
ncbi:MAG: hypothetical protein DI535_07015 [Citrobacter freundii]|nr:MAG: hypothetical protein DI535_07015 [Citrobacter freundii]